MIEDHETLTEDEQGPAPVTFTTRRDYGRGGRRLRLKGWLRRRRERPPRPKIRKLRVFLVGSAFLVLAAISAVFGMLTSIASDLPQLENTVEFSSSVDSYLYDVNGTPIGPLAPPTTPVLVNWKSLSANMNMVHAIVAVEDKRFWSSPGVDIRGLARAALNDLAGGATQGASTIPEQFVKQVRNAENNRTIFEKLVEAGLAFQLVHHWSKQKILTEYLNSIYFGNGATGVEAAARTYFGKQYGYNAANPAGEPRTACGDPDAHDQNRKYCVEMLTPAQAALLAGMVANPTAFDPLLHPQASLGRRNQVLQLMYQQGYINRGQYQRGTSAPLPTAVQQPQEPSAAPYFTSWVRPQVINALQHMGLSQSQAQHEAYYGGLKVRLTIDLKLQNAAQQVVDSIFPPGSHGPSASLVAIDNKTGEVRAMVSGDGNYKQAPFNLATLGYRQPGSSFKIFTLAAALQRHVATPNSVFDSKPIKIPYRDSRGRTELFPVHNFANEYLGPETLTTATMISDNSVFVQLGMKVGTKHIAHYAKRMGIRSPITTNPSMILGGAKGVSALDMAHAYETVATGGVKLWNPILGDIDRGPIGIDKISDCRPCRREHQVANHPKAQRVLSPTVASEIQTLLRGPVSPHGTAPLAAIPGVPVSGKTGTTTHYVDGWFVGWTPELTVAVWVGYPKSGKPMRTNYKGGPVEGGTFPAIIWHNFMVDALQIISQEAAGKSAGSSSSAGSTINPSTLTSSSTTSTPATTSTPTQSTSATSTPATTTTPQNAGGQTTTPAGSNHGGNSGGAGAGGGGSSTSTTTTPTAGAGNGGSSGSSGSGSGSSNPGGSGTGSPSGTGGGGGSGTGGKPGGTTTSGGSGLP